MQNNSSNAIFLREMYVYIDGAIDFTSANQSVKMTLHFY
jgi:hypothetical protein